MVKESQLRLEKKKNLKKKQIKEKQYDGRQECRSYTTKKKHDSNFRPAAGTVDSRSGLSTARGPESNSDFLFRCVQVSFLVDSE